MFKKNAICSFIVFSIIAASMPVYASSSDFNSMMSDAQGKFSEELTNTDGSTVDFGNDAGQSLDSILDGSTSMDDYLNSKSSSPSTNAGTSDNIENKNDYNLPDETNSSDLDAKKPFETDKLDDIENTLDPDIDNHTDISDSGITSDTSDVDMSSELQEMKKEMEANADNILKDLLGNSYTGIDTSIYDIKNEPSVSIEDLNIKWADMQETFKENGYGKEYTSDTPSLKGYSSDLKAHMQETFGKDATSSNSDFSSLLSGMSETRAKSFSKVIDTNTYKDLVTDISIGKTVSDKKTNTDTKKDNSSSKKNVNTKKKNDSSKKKK